MSTTPTIQDKAPKPAGLLPKHVQSWLLAALAVLMVLIMWLTGGKKPPTTTRPMPTAPGVVPPLEVNEGKIVELQKRIADLQREQALAASALAQNHTPVPEAAVQYPPNSVERPEDAIRAERKKREYLSLFASNVALSFRKGMPSKLSRDENSTNPLTSSFDAAAPQFPESASSISAPSPASIANTTIVEGRRKEDAPKPAAETSSTSAATGKNYVLFEGTVLETVLLNRLDGQFTGPVECLLTNDVYSHDRQHLLIPAGSKVLGETRKVEAFGQTRLAVAFHRMVMPDGFSATLDRFQGLNQVGDAGLRDQVNNHYMRIFGASLAIGALGAIAEGGTSGPLTASGTDLMRQGFAQSTAQSSAQILDKFLNVLPTITIREGHRIKVYLSGDLALPDYANHAVPSNL